MKTPLRALGLLAVAASIALGATACGGPIQFHQVPDAEEEAHTAARFPAASPTAPALDPASAAAGEIAKARAVLAQSAGTDAAAATRVSDPALHSPAAWPSLGHEGLCRFVARTVTHAADTGSAVSGAVREAAQKVLSGC